MKRTGFKRLSWNSSISRVDNVKEKILQCLFHFFSESFGEHLSVLDSPPNCSNKRYQSLPWSRPVFTSDQRTTLEHHFQLQHYLTKRERYFLSLHLGLTEHQIKIWFQNRRVKHRNAVKEEKQRTRNTCVRGGVTFLPREQHE